MKKFGVLMLIVLISLGVVVVMGGCGGGGGGGLPKSSPSYAGSNLPAVIDSTTAVNFFMVPWDLELFMSGISLDGVEEDTETIEGSVSGTITHYSRAESTSSPTKDTYKELDRYTFDNYADDGKAFEGILAADGVVYWEDRYEYTYTGEEPLSLGVGEVLSLRALMHENYSAFYFSDEFDEEERSGWSTVDITAADEDFVGPWEIDFGANIAMNSYSGDYYLALLDAEANMAWDGSFTTYSGQGTVCVEGDAEYEIIGCFDVVFDMRWDENGEGQPVEYYPLDGTMEVSTINASAMFEFGSSASDPTCYILYVDADGNDVYEFQEEICDED